MTLKSKLVAAVVLASLSLGVSQSAFAQPITVQGEEAAHPRMVEAIRHMRAALEELQAAPHDFGGFKGVAIMDTKRAIHSVRKALYYRLKMDDAALDRMQ